MHSWLKCVYMSTVQSVSGAPLLICSRSLCSNGAQLTEGPAGRTGIAGGWQGAAAQVLLTALRRPAQQLSHERDVSDGQTQRLDPRETLLVGERRHLSAIERLFSRT